MEIVAAPATVPSVPPAVADVEIADTGASTLLDVEANAPMLALSVEQVAAAPSVSDGMGPREAPFRR